MNSVPLILLVSAFVFLPTSLHAAACCVGGNPKSFISLQRLESYEVGISTGVRDVYGQFNAYGELEAAAANQSTTVAFGAGARLTPDLQVTATLPWVYQVTQFGPTPQGSAAIGDVLLGAQYLLVESLFQEDWYPTVTVYSGIKMPTGAAESRAGAALVPGTGNGYWEPYAAVGLQKWLGPLQFVLRAGYSPRFKNARFNPGDSVELVEAATYSLHPRLSFTLGSSQTWYFSDRFNGQPIADSAGRIATLFFTPTYFLTRYWSVTAGVEFALPLATFGVNLPAARSASLTARYGFF